MTKQTIRQVVINHQPCGGGYGVAVQCWCGDDFSAEHQLERLEAAGYQTQEVQS